MVQRTSPVRLERQSSCHAQQDDLKKKKMKLERSIRAADLKSLQDSAMKQPRKRSPVRGSPNYMKPTSSSDARKEKVKVTPSPSSKIATNKKTTPRSSKNSGPCSRPLIKKSLVKTGVVNRATCSSTLKCFKFPDLLDLSHGGTEAEGTSMIRVCPYNYCSLHGHRHEAMPPFKCFMSASRTLLKTQKSMNLKGVCSIRSEVVGKDKKNDTGQRAKSKDVTDIFFVEIYTTRSPEELVIDEKARVKEEDHQMKEAGVETNAEDDVDKSSEHSDEEVDAKSFLEFVECEQQVNDAGDETTIKIVPEENGESYEDVTGNESNVVTFDFNSEEAGIPFSDNVTECSECCDDYSGLMPRQADCCIEPIAALDACEGAEADAACHVLVAVGEDDAEFKQEVDHQVAEIDDAMAPDGGNSEGSDSDSDEGEELCRADVSDQISKSERPEISVDKDDSFHLSDSKDNISDAGFQDSEGVVSDESEDGNEAGETLLNDDEDNRIFKLDSLLENISYCNDIKESKLFIMDGNHMRTVLNCDDATECTSISSDVESCSSHDLSETSYIAESWESDYEQQKEVSPIERSIAKSNATLRIRRKKTAEEPDAFRDFNPRAPRFLDMEPDPEAEKVDLRHQEMDERKNLEEYLLDYALRRAVKKLAPARQRKVALLVEAFETVMLLPVCEKSLRHSTPGFIHGRTMQACI